MTTRRSARRSAPRDTREDVFLAAAELFSARGIDGVGVDDIAHAARINKAMIYYHFEDKLALYREVVRDMLRAVGTMAGEIADRPDPADQRLSAFVAGMVTLADQRPWFPPLMLREIAEGAPRLDPDTIALMKTVFVAFHRILAEGQQAGVFRAGQPGPRLHVDRRSAARQCSQRARRRAPRPRRPPDVRAMCRTRNSSPTCSRRRSRLLAPEPTAHERLILVRHRRARLPPPAPSRRPRTRCACRATSKPPKRGSRRKPAAASSPSRSKEGDRIEAGTEMLTLDTRDVELAIDRARAERAQAEAKLRLVLAGARAEDIRQAESQVAAARAEVSRRASRARRRRAGPRPVRDAARQQLRLAQAARRCGDEARRGEGARVAARRAGCAPREEALARLRAGARREEVDAARARVAAVPTRRSPRSRRAIADATFRSPVGGIVTEKLVEVGEIIAPRAPVAVVADLDHAWADVFVPEPAVPRLEIGQAAHGLHRCRRRAALPAPSPTSRRRRSSRRATCRPRRSARSSSTASASRVDNNDGVLKQGMPVEAEIRAAAADDELAAARLVQSNRERQALRRRSQALRGVSLRASSRGEMFGLIGPDGAGKTTTIRAALRAAARRRRSDPRARPRSGARAPRDHRIGRLPVAALQPLRRSQHRREHRVLRRDPRRRAIIARGAIGCSR